MSNNNNVNVLGKIVLFVGIVFLLFGVLFGAQIFSFIFGNIGLASSSSIPLATDTVINLTNVFINETGFTIPQASNVNFTGGFAVTNAINTTSGEVIPAANYTVVALTGTITNGTVVTYAAIVNLSYTVTVKTPTQIAIESVNNNSLNAVVTYTEQADTQLNTAAIAITLLILIALFLVFWVAFIRPMMQQSSGKTTGGNFA